MELLATLESFARRHTAIIGEYVDRIFNETKLRPLYLVDTILQSDQQKATAPPLSAQNSPQGPVRKLANRLLIEYD